MSSAIAQVWSIRASLPSSIIGHSAVILWRFPRLEKNLPLIASGETSTLALLFISIRCFNPSAWSLWPWEIKTLSTVLRSIPIFSALRIKISLAPVSSRMRCLSVSNRIDRPCSVSNDGFWVRLSDNTIHFIIYTFVGLSLGVSMRPDDMTL